MLTKIPLYGDLDFLIEASMHCHDQHITCLPTVGGITTDAGDDVGRIAGGVSGGGVLLVVLIIIVIVIVKVIFTKVKVWKASN